MTTISLKSTGISGDVLLKVTAFIGSARKKHTYIAAEKFMQNLKPFGNIDTEIVHLNEYNLGTCNGCKLCLDKGEEFCQFQDDRDILIEKINSSDGVIFASPNYSFNVSAIMKIFLDRLGFLFHRPRFFGKTFTSIVTQGIFRGEEIVKYFNFIGNGLGFNVVKGSCIQTLEPMTGKGQKKIDTIIERQSKIFYSTLIKKEYPTPSLLKLLIFRTARSSMNLLLNDNYIDYNYYRENGWFESDYYYPVKLSPIKKLSGKYFDRLGIKTAKNS